MTSSPSEQSERFIIVCIQCNAEIVARHAWIGREVRCPHCRAEMAVPPPNADGTPTRGDLPKMPSFQRFNFACPRCNSLLESGADMIGQTCRCPTCAARFIVPRLSRTGTPDRAQLIDIDPQDPTPMHAYAASGHQAPRIARRANGELQIVCPRCERCTDIGANSCPGCGIPFTIEGVPNAAGKPGGAYGIAAVTLGILALPLAFFLVVGMAAVISGIASWLRSTSSRPSGQALTGIILGSVSIVLGLLIHLA